MTSQVGQNRNGQLTNDDMSAVWDYKFSSMFIFIILRYNKHLELKKRIMRCLIWSVALYAAETWTLTKQCGYGENGKN